MTARPLATVPHDGGMSTPRTVTVATVTTKTLGQIAYEASDPTENRAHWCNLSDVERGRWERIAEAVAKALELNVHVPAPVSVDIHGRLVPSPQPADPFNPVTWPHAPPWMTLSAPETEPPRTMKPWPVFPWLPQRKPDTDKNP
jgi:hypothetical protein